MIIHLLCVKGGGAKDGISESEMFEHNVHTHFSCNYPPLSKKNERIEKSHYIYLPPPPKKKKSY